MIYTLYFFSTCLLLLISTIPAQGQKLEFTDPEPLNIINTYAEEVKPILTPDGQFIYFVRGFHEDNNGGQYAGMDIWRSQKDSLGNWQSPTNQIDSWNNKDNNAVIGIRKDGQVIYLLNSYFRGKGVAFSKFIKGKWIKPELLPLKWLKSTGFIDLYMHPDFDVLLISMKGEESDQGEDLFVSLKDNSGNWSDPISLGPTINTDGFEISPYLTKDKKRLFFSSNGHSGMGGADIFMSERLYEDWTVWTKPVNLGEKINSKGFDAYFSIGTDSTAYFSSNRDSSLADIYQAKIKINKINILQDSINRIISQADSILNSLEQFNQNRNLILNLKYRGETSELNNEMKATLNNFIRNVAKEDLLGIILKGFPEKYGNNNLNLKLIEKRNREVKQFLVKSGFEEKAIATKIVTFPNPRSSNENTVEVKFIYR